MSSFTISGALVFDGSGRDGEKRDVHVSRGRIVETQNDPDVEIIDGTGYALCPGFIDVHTHDDTAVLTQPQMSFKTLQGVTTVIVGNCGMSIAPRGSGLMGSLEVDSFSTYFDRLRDEPPAVNVAALVGHGSIRAKVMGTTTRREASQDELRIMAKLVEEALNDGVMGISTGLAYEPGRYSPTDEIVQLTELVAQANGIYATHMRNDGDELLSSVEESLHIGAETGARIQISHLKVMGKRNHGSIGDAVRLIQEARRQGIDVMADQYPYTRGSTILDQLVSGGQIIAINRDGLHHLEALLISSSPQHPEWEGMTLRDLAQHLGLGDKETVEYALAECGRSLFVVIDSLNEDDVRRVMKEDFVMIGSDGVPTGSKPHPRLHHTFPRVLAEYVRNLGLISLPSAIHKMTGMSAQRFGLANRGFIAEGYAADLVLFDPHTIQDTGTYIEPTTVPTGIKEVWVNGTRVAEDGRSTDRRPGIPLTRQ